MTATPFFWANAAAKTADTEEMRMKKLSAVILAALLILCVFCGCGGNNDTVKGIRIVCTAFPQYDFAKNVLGDIAGSVVLLTENGEDLHSYEATASDIVEIGTADLFIYVGGVSDEWVGGILKSANNPELKTLAIMDCVETLDEERVAGMHHEHEHEEKHGHEAQKDEHVWLSLTNAAAITDAISGRLCEIDPANASAYSANASAYIQKLNSLDSEYRNVVDSAKRNVLLFADRFPFRYLTESYGIEYHAAFAGCSSESEASFETMAFLIDKTKELSLPVVLTIDGSDGSLAKTVCSETGAESRTLNSCQSVSKSDIENGTTYLGIMTSNLEVLKEALN